MRLISAMLAINVSFSKGLQQANPRNLFLNVTDSEAEKAYLQSLNEESKAVSNKPWNVKTYKYL